MKGLLEKTRILNKLLQKNAGNSVDFKDMAKVLTEMIDCNTYIISSKGKILGHAFLSGFECNVVDSILEGTCRFTSKFNDFLLDKKETEGNIQHVKGLCTFVDSSDCSLNGKVFTIVPIIGSGKRQGTLLISKMNAEFTDADLILAEYGATVVGMEILRSKADKFEEEARKKAAVQIAIETLSYSEGEAIEHIFKELEGSEGLLVASKIADRVGITRSVIVNALRKFESAGVIESKSLGMKGTFIRVLNEYLLDEIKKLNR